MAAEMNLEASQVTCKFTSHLPDQYQVPTTEIAVPSSLTRYGLSQVVNHLLGLEDSVPFDFLINGTLVRTSLGKFLLANNISAESVLDVEYVLAITPPEPKLQMPTDDWVGAIDGSNDAWLATGCYDGQLRFWNDQSTALGAREIHRGPISSVHSIPNQPKPILVTTGKVDCTVKLHKISLSKSGKVKAAPVAVCKGHKASVLDAASSPSGEKLVSASQDGSLRLWPTGSEAIDLASQGTHAENGSQSKRLRSENGNGVDSPEPVLESEQTFNGHKDGATCVTWLGPHTIASGSMDFTVRKWNADTGTNIDTYHGHRALSCITSSASGSFLAFGGASNTWHLWDTRQRPDLDAGLKAFNSHTSHLHAISWHPTSEHYVATASLDKTAKLWDIRSSVPLHTLEGHEEQVLCVTWWGESRLATGSADKSVKVFDVKLGLDA